jgi:hypothetical protein
MEYGVIIKEPFQGSAQTVVENGKPYFSNLTLEEYLNKEPGLKLVSGEEFANIHEQYWTKPFKEISEDDYWMYFEQLPPRKFLKTEQYSIFFDYEPMSGSMHGVYIWDKKTKKYYAGMMSIFNAHSEVIKKYEKEILNQNH